MMKGFHFPRWVRIMVIGSNPKRTLVRLLVLVVMILSLPAFMLDLFIVGNITLSLDGRIRPVKGVLPIACEAGRLGAESLLRSIEGGEALQGQTSVPHALEHGWPPLPWESPLVARSGAG